MAAQQPLQLRKAERFKAKLRIGLFGPSGSGKTYSALKLASGIASSWEKVCLIDTENGSGDLYSHLGPYSVIPLTPPYEPEKYVLAIQMAQKAGMEVVIIDSITHEWSGTGGVLEEADRLSATMRDGRQVWTKLTPRHNRFIDAILQSPMHTISCGRSKMEVVMTERESNGRTVKVPEKMGLKAITREGFEYEMTISFDIAINHYATCSKDRTTGPDGKAIFIDRPPRILGSEEGDTLLQWSQEGGDKPEYKPPLPAPELWKKALREHAVKKLPPEQQPKAIAYINDKITYAEAYEKMTRNNLLTDEPTRDELIEGGVIDPNAPEKPKDEPAAPPKVDGEAVVLENPPAPQEAPPTPPATGVDAAAMVFEGSEEKPKMTPEQTAATGTAHVKDH